MYHAYDELLVNVCQAENLRNIPFRKKKSILLDILLIRAWELWWIIIGRAYTKIRIYINIMVD